MDLIDIAIAKQLAGGSGGGSGTDGFSPIVTVSDIAGGHRISIQDKTTTQTFDVMDGQDADPAAIIDDTTASASKVYSSSKINTELAGKVSSSSVSNIWQGTQLEYDAIVTKDNATLYFIKEG